MMKHLQFYKYSTWGLLLLNISMIAFFLLTAPPPHQKHKRNKLSAATIMNLDEQQDKSFLQLAQQHIKQMDDFNNQQRSLLKPYFSSIIDQSRVIDSDSLLHQIKLLEGKKIESTYRHFQDIKAILKPEQYPGFEDFVEHAIGRILLENKKNPPPPKDFD